MKGCWLNDRYVYSRLGCAYHCHHRSSSATLNLEPSSVLRAIPNIFPVSFFSNFYYCDKSCINKKNVTQNLAHSVEKGLLQEEH